MYNLISFTISFLLYDVYVYYVIIEDPSITKILQNSKAFVSISILRIKEMIFVDWKCEKLEHKLCAFCLDFSFQTHNYILNHMCKKRSCKNLKQ